MSQRSSLIFFCKFHSSRFRFRVFIFRSFRPCLYYKFLSQALLDLMNFDMSFHFHLVQCILGTSFEISSLMHGLFRHMLFSFQVFGDFLVFFLLLISLWFRTYSTWFRFLKKKIDFVLWPRMWSLLVHILWALEKNMYPAVVE